MQGKDMYLSFNLEPIYEGANFNINNQDKVGITGVNGAGKTTLFNVILGNIKLDAGKLIISNNKRLGYLPQEVTFYKDETVYEYLLSGRPIKKLETDIADLYTKINTLQDNKEINKYLKIIGKKQEELEHLDYYNYENVLLNLIDNMHIDISMLDQKVSDLSGGQKSKIAFAKLIYSNADILMLDEPTNHLDIDTRDFIINYLKNYQGMILVISHDINFLDAITTKTMYLDKVTHLITVYDGNYSEFKKKYDKQKELMIRKQSQEEKEYNRLREIVLHYSNSSGKRKKMAQDREKKLSKLADNMIKVSDNYKQVKVRFKMLQENSSIPLTVNNLTFHYPNKDDLYDNLSFLINKKERFLIIGENGTGKSTLLKLITKVLKPIKGDIHYGNKEIISYYAQEQENLDPNKSIIDNVKLPNLSLNEIRGYLSRFLFNGDDILKLVKVLSPGEKARVSLCKVIMAQANLILLDEPTNHLDPETQEIIGANFHEYPGTIIMVSHNPSFVKKVGVDRMLILPSGKITNYDEELLYKYHTLNDLH
jgi:ATP-binding cassette subfamily F protein 3